MALCARISVNDNLSGAKMFSKIKKEYVIFFSLILLSIAILGLLIFFSMQTAKQELVNNQETINYIVKIRNAYEEIDQILERAEVNTNVMVDSIANTYDTKKSTDKNYNLAFTNNLNGLIQSVLSNSPSVNGAWFQINSKLPFSASAYNWFEYKNDNFINQRNPSETTRPITEDDDPYYFSAIQNNGQTWSRVYNDADTNEQMITISAPVYKNGYLIGVAGLDILTGTLQQTLNNIQLMLFNSEIYLTDKDNNLILYQLEPGVNLDDIDTSFLNIIRQNEDGATGFSKNLTTKTIIKLTLSNNYKFIVAIDNRNLFTNSNKSSNMIYLLLGLLTLITISTFISMYEVINLKNANRKLIEAASQATEEEQET